MFGTLFSQSEDSANLAEKQLSLLITSGNPVVLGVSEGEEGQTDENTGPSVSDVVAQQLTQAEEISQEQVDSVVDDIENDRREKLRGQIGLEVPKETDNPNLPITFSNPSNEAFEIQVDGGGFSPVISPYSLPALSIGEHVLNFRFVDTEGISQNLEETIVVIPRAPVWSEGLKKEYNGDDTLSFEGTALPNSRIVLLAGSSLQSVVVDSDTEGKWKASIDNTFDSGSYTAVAFVRKSGYSSNFSEPFVFSVGKVSGVSVEGESGDTRAEDDIDYLFGYIPYTEQTYVYVISIVGLVAVIVLFVLSAIFRSLLRSRSISRDALKTALSVRNAASSQKVPSFTTGKVSLREKFKKAGIGVGNGMSVSAGVLENVKDSPSETDGPAVEQETVEQETDDKDEVTPKKSTKKIVKKVTQKQEASPISEKPETVDLENPDGEDKTHGDNKSTNSPFVQSPSSEELSSPTIETNSETEQGTDSTDKLEPVPGKVYSKSEFMKAFKTTKTTVDKETNKLRISLTSNKGK